MYAKAASGKNTASSASNGNGNVARTIGSAPPTASLQDLVLLRDAKEEPKKVYAISSKDEFTQLKKELSAKLVPFRELISAVTSRTKRLTDRRKGIKSTPAAKGGKAVPGVFDSKADRFSAVF